MKFQNLIFLGSVLGLNYQDSIYSATALLQKVLPDNPMLFPIFDGTALINADDTLDYSSLYNGAETSYDAINSYTVAILRYLPDVLTKEQASDFIKSLNLINNIQTEDEALGQYCNMVYKRLYDKFNTMYQLEPLVDSFIYTPTTSDDVGKDSENMTTLEISSTETLNLEESDTTSIDEVGTTETLNLEESSTGSIDEVSPTETLNLEESSTGSIDEVSTTETLNLEESDTTSIDEVSPTETLNLEESSTTSIDEVSPTETLNLEESSTGSIDEVSPTETLNLEESSTGSIDEVSTTETLNLEKSSAGSIDEILNLEESDTTSIDEVSPTNLEESSTSIIDEVSSDTKSSVLESKTTAIDLSESTLSAHDDTQWVTQNQLLDWQPAIEITTTFSIPEFTELGDVGIDTVTSSSPINTQYEIILQKRSSYVQKETFNDELNGEYSDADVPIDYVDKFLTNHQSILKTLQGLTEINGENMFIDNQIITPILSEKYLESTRTTLISETESSDDEIILERRDAELDFENLRSFNERAEQYRSLFLNKRSKLQNVMGKMSKLANEKSLDKKLSIAATALSAVAAAAQMLVPALGTVASFGLSAMGVILKTSSLFIASSRHYKTTDEQNAIFQMIDIDFVAFELSANANGKGLESYNLLVERGLDSVKNNPDKSVVARMFELAGTEGAEIFDKQKYAKILKLGYSGFLQSKIDELMVSDDDGKWTQMDRTIMSLNKLSLITSQIDDKGFDGIDLHDNKQKWLKTYGREINQFDPSSFATEERLIKLKTPVDHLADEIDNLVNLVGDDLTIDSTNADDPTKFFQDNENVLKGLKSKKASEARNIYRNMIHHLSNCQSNGEYNQDVVSLKNILVGEDDQSGLFGKELKSKALKRAAMKINNGQKSKTDKKGLKSRIGIKPPSKSNSK
jgi:hypothetical protein